MYLGQNALLQGGKYKIERHISSGGFGNTYEAYHILLKKKVAIKEFFAKSFCNRDKDTMKVVTGVTSKTALVSKLMHKFIEEAQAVSSLRHPNIVNVHDVFEENGTAYFVMDYIDGMSLKDKLQGGVMSEQEALKYIRHVADALSYVHSCNRLHLDIKPGNIMIDEYGNAILIDFGASKQYDEVDGENTSTLMGTTPGFAPLEQMSNDVMKFYPSTDIYALGATLYKLLSGVTPPNAGNLASGVAELKPLPASVSQNVRNAVLQSMQMKKNARPQNIDEFLKLLDAPQVTVAEVVDVVDDEETHVLASGNYNTKQNVGADNAGTVPPAVGAVTTESDSKPTSNKTNDEGLKRKKKAGKTTKIVVISVVVVLFALSVGLVMLNRNSTSKAVDQGATVEHKVTEKQEVTEIVVQMTNATFKDAKGRNFTYTGEAINGKPNGTGTGVYSYGTYTGEYKNGMRVGNGKFKSKDGSNHYEGSFVGDEYDTGKLTLGVGDYFEGKFKDGEPYEGMWYTKDGKEDGKVTPKGPKN